MLYWGSDQRTYTLLASQRVCSPKQGLTEAECFEAYLVLLGWAVVLQSFLWPQTTKLSRQPNVLRLVTTSTGKSTNQFTRIVTATNWAWQACLVLIGWVVACQSLFYFLLGSPRSRRLNSRPNYSAFVIQSKTAEAKQGSWHEEPLRERSCVIRPCAMMRIWSLTLCRGPVENNEKQRRQWYHSPH